MTICTFSFILPTMLFMQYSCSKMENLNVIPNPYEYRASSDFIAVFGDIQYYTNSSHIDLFKHSLNWIEYVSNNNVNILCALHTGDITQTNDLHEWSYFGNAVKKFSESIPFISNIGDHDYTWDKNSKITDRNSTHFNEYCNFSLVTNRIEAFFEPGRMENIVIRNEIHGRRYDFLLLEFAPRREVVEWAKEWVSSHPDVKYILINHEYLESGGGRRTSGLKCIMRLKDTNYLKPDELWQQLVKCNNNIMCVLCGHVGGLYAVTFEENDFGRSVCQIQHNIQSPDYRYDNWLMIWEFPEGSDYATVSIINTRSGQFFESTEKLFEFQYKY